MRRDSRTSSRNGTPSAMCSLIEDVRSSGTPTAQRNSSKSSGCILTTCSYPNGERSSRSGLGHPLTHLRLQNSPSLTERTSPLLSSRVPAATMSASPSLTSGLMADLASSQSWMLSRKSRVLPLSSLKPGIRASRLRYRPSGSMPSLNRSRTHVPSEKSSLA